MKYNSVRISLIIFLVILLVTSTTPAFYGSYFLEENSSAYEEVVKTGCPLPLLSPPVTIDKKVRINPDDPWQDSITTPICTDLEFKIWVHNTKITPKNVVVTDYLPSILNYVHGSANPEPDSYYNDTEEVIVWIMNLPAWTTKTITYHAELVSPGYGENYVHVVPLLPGQEPDDDTVPVTGINNPPNNPSTPDPYDGEINVDVDHDLYWTGGDPDICDTVTYDVYFDTVDPPAEKVSSNQSATIYDPGALDPGETYYWKIIAWDQYGASTTGPVWDFTTEDPNLPPVFSNENPLNGQPNVPVSTSSLSVYISDPEGDSYDWSITTNPDIGSSSSTGEYDGTKTCSISGLEYSTTYNWTVSATDTSGSGETTEETYTFTTESEINNPPNKPTISGPTTAPAGAECEYTFNAVDPNGDDVKYHIDWDDSNSETTDFFSSGADVKVKHTWTNQDTYIIRVTAEDANGLIGPEGSLTVTMPRNKAMRASPFLSFLSNHPTLFPLLQRLFLRLGLQK